MSDEVKFTTEEMSKIKELQNSYINIQSSMGQLEVQSIRLQQQLDALGADKENLKSQFVQIQSNERDFVEQINKKYGDGNLDITSGIFTPKESTETK